MPFEDHIEKMRQANIQKQLDQDARIKAKLLTEKEAENEYKAKRQECVNEASQELLTSPEYIQIVNDLYSPSLNEALTYIWSALGIRTKSSHLSIFSKSDGTMPAKLNIVKRFPEIPLAGYDTCFTSYGIGKPHYGKGGGGHDGYDVGFQNKIKYGFSNYRYSDSFTSRDFVRQALTLGGSIGWEASEDDVNGSCVITDTYGGVSDGLSMPDPVTSYQRFFPRMLEVVSYHSPKADQIRYGVKGNAIKTSGLVSIDNVLDYLASNIDIIKSTTHHEFVGSRWYLLGENLK